jgi:hypothetical protein
LGGELTATIIGDGIIPEARYLDDLAKGLQFEETVYLLANIAPLLGITLKNEVIYNAEPLYDGCRSFSIGYEQVLRDNIVLDYNRKNVEYLKSLGIDAFHCPYGFHESLVRPVGAEKDIDVLVVGSTNPRRERLLKQFIRPDLNFVWIKSGAYGRNLDELIARAKVILNVHYCDLHPLEVFRLNYLMANHANVVSEKCWDEEVNKQYESGLRFCSEPELLKTCLDAIDNPIDGFECIKRIPMDCTKAQEWIRTK